MKVLSSFLVVLLASTVLMAGGMDVAEAKRLGGGVSFGDKFSYSQPVKKSIGQNQLLSSALNQNVVRKQALTQKGGFVGMFGALALGGLLGAMFFGGTFDGVNLMDIIIFGLIIFLLLKLMARKAQSAASGGYGSTAPHYGDVYQQSQSGSETGGGQAADDVSLDDLRSAVPKQFDQADFIDGARNCFVRLQKSWDEGDLADIRQFTTDHVFGEIQDQLHDRDSHSQTEIISLEAELLSASGQGNKHEAIVLFRGELKEDGQQHMIEEVWHFVKPANNQQPSWVLDGIQQVKG